jgi:hypothetical protein
MTMSMGQRETWTAQGTYTSAITCVLPTDHDIIPMYDMLRSQSPPLATMSEQQHGILQIAHR